MVEKVGERAVITHSPCVVVGGRATYSARLHSRSIDSVRKGPAFLPGPAQSSGSFPESGGGVVASDAACSTAHPASITGLMGYHEEGFFKTLRVGPRSDLFAAGSRTPFEAPYSSSADMIGQRSGQRVAGCWQEAGWSGRQSRVKGWSQQSVGRGEAPLDSLRGLGPGTQCAL